MNQSLPKYLLNETLVWYYRKKKKPENMGHPNKLCVLLFQVSQNINCVKNKIATRKCAITEKIRLESL